MYSIKAELTLTISAAPGRFPLEEHSQLCSSNRAIGYVLLVPLLMTGWLNKSASNCTIGNGKKTRSVCMMVSICEQMSGTSGTSLRREDRMLDPARTGRDLHRSIHDSAAGALLDRLELGGAHALMHLCRALPDRGRTGMANLLRDTAFQLLSRQRRICYGNLTIARGSVWETERIRSFTKQVFGYWCRAFVDFARLRMEMTRTNWD